MYVRHLPMAREHISRVNSFRPVREGFPEASHPGQAAGGSGHLRVPRRQSPHNNERKLALHNRFCGTANIAPQLRAIANILEQFFIGCVSRTRSFHALTLHTSVKGTYLRSYNRPYMWQKFLEADDGALLRRAWPLPSGASDTFFLNARMGLGGCRALDSVATR
jgi:hypothetical protein